IARNAPPIDVRKWDSRRRARIIAPSPPQSRVRTRRHGSPRLTATDRDHDFESITRLEHGVAMAMLRHDFAIALNSHPLVAGTLGRQQPRNGGPASDRALGAIDNDRDCLRGGHRVIARILVRPAAHALGIDDAAERSQRGRKQNVMLPSQPARNAVAAFQSMRSRCDRSRRRCHRNRPIATAAINANNQTSYWCTSLSRLSTAAPRAQPRLATIVAHRIAPSPLKNAKRAALTPEVPINTGPAMRKP